ncbi:reprolysin-like metallopeptidase [Nocardioides sp.]|uniref:reprolysin-like metallopeptidase n=1 Tax=Nocardioides sp. TaxID=35761 RepID=UPI0035150A93
MTRLPRLPARPTRAARGTRPDRTTRAVATLVLLAAGVLAVPLATAQAGPGAGPALTAAPTTTGWEGSAFAPAGDVALRRADARVRPAAYTASRVDTDALRAQLPAPGTTAVVAIPDPQGRLRRYRLTPTVTMEPGLAAAHPNIRTFSGTGLDDDTRLALDVAPTGVHAYVRGSVGGGWFLDPAYNARGTDLHLSYVAAALPRPQARRAEGAVRALRELAESRADSRAARGPDRTAGRRVVARTYRLALLNDPTYAAYFGSANVLAEKVTLINRVNAIYGDDLAVRLVLIDGTDRLNLDTQAAATGPDGPCGAHPCFDPADDNGTATTTDDVPGQLDFCDDPALGRTRTVLGQLVGASAYDIGHLVLGVNGGGIANVGVVGGDYKAGGCTGLPRPQGDFFAIDYVAHEMGHQFGANHTFAGALGPCGGNIARSSVEPGSGATVMAYAGICGRDNLQDHTDPVFSFNSLREMRKVTTGTPYDNVEVQTVSLRGFDTDGEQIVLGFPGTAQTRTLTRGSTYTRAGVATAIEELTGVDNVTVVEWGFDEFLRVPPRSLLDDTGFQVIFSAEPSVLLAGPADTDLASLTVSSPSPGVSGFVGETARGGPSQNRGVARTVANRNPVVTAPADRTIPIRTPFRLTGSGRDADGDRLVYLWEQTDTSAASRQLATSDRPNGPLFRVFGQAAQVSPADALRSPSPGQNLPGRTPTRWFPDLAQVLDGNTNARTGRCPAPRGPLSQTLPARQLECYSEVLPTARYRGTDRRYALHFRLTARDRADAGGQGYADVTLRLDRDAGPFLVTSQARAVTYRRGERITVRWAVNGTRPLARQVRIRLSTDGGRTFRTTLARTANDGRQEVRLPRRTTGRARIMIEAVDNYFYAVNRTGFRIR